MLVRDSNENEKAAIAGGIAGKTHSYFEIWCNRNFTHGPLCKKLLPWIDGLLDASEEHFAATAVIQLSYD
jgi:fructose-bisphosphate aldolase class II